MPALGRLNHAKRAHPLYNGIAQHNPWQGTALRFPSPLHHHLNVSLKARPDSLFGSQVQFSAQASTSMKTSWLNTW